MRDDGPVVAETDSGQRNLVAASAAGPLRRASRRRREIVARHLPAPMRTSKSELGTGRCHWRRLRWRNVVRSARLPKVNVRVSSSALAFCSGRATMCSSDDKSSAHPRSRTSLAARSASRRRRATAARPIYVSSAPPAIGKPRLSIATASGMKGWCPYPFVRP